MKTAKDWIDELSEDDGVGCLAVINANDIKQIQLDAMKEGARRAAVVCDGNPDWMPADNDECKSAILTTAEQWTEKDL